MWGWANRYWWCCCFVPETLQKHHNQNLLLTTRRPQNDAVDSTCISFAAVARMFASWLNRRRRRYLLLILFSPLIIPLIFAAFPFVCAAEIWCCVCRKRAAAGEGDRRGCSGDGGVVEAGLMQRYLEDQLMLVVGSVYGCGDDDQSGEEEEEEGDGVDVKYLDSARPLLQ